MNIVFLIFGFLHGVLSEFTDYVSETAVGSVFTGREVERTSKRAASHSFSHLPSKSWPVKMEPTAFSEILSVYSVRSIRGLVISEV